MGKTGQFSSNEHDHSNHYFLILENKLFGFDKLFRGRMSDPNIETSDPPLAEDDGVKADNSSDRTGNSLRNFQGFPRVSKVGANCDGE